MTTQNRVINGVVAVNIKRRSCCVVVVQVPVLLPKARLGIPFQRNLRTKKTLTSELENVPLISKAKSIALIKHFKSVNKIKEASIVELMKVDGIGEKLAKNIFDYFNK